MQVKQGELPIYINNREVFQPTDNVILTYSYNGQTLQDEVSLDDISNYYKFKNHIGLFLFEKLVD